MKNKRVSALSVGLIFALILSMLFAVGCGNEEYETPPTVKNTELVTEAFVNKTEAEGSTAKENGSSVATNENDSEEMSVAETSATNPIPETTEEIVALFNKSANRIKTDAVKVVKNYEKRIVNEEYLVVPQALDSTARSMMKTFLKDDTEPIVYETREDITNEYLVPNQTYVSRLTPADVAKATVTDEGSTYVIYIKLKDQKNPVPGKGVGSVFDVIETSEVAEKASFVENFTTDYYNCEVTVTVDKATGNVIHANYSTPLILDITVNLFGTHDASAGLTFEKDYTIIY